VASTDPEMGCDASPVASFEGLGRGALWSGLSSIMLRAGSLLIGVVTARILAPRDIGVFAVALTVHMVLLSISELGIGAALTRTTGDPGDLAPTLGTLALIMGAVTSGIMVLVAPQVSSTLGSPAATGPVRVLALTLVVSSVATVPAALLAREFRQDKRFLAEVSGFVVSSVVLLLLLWGGAGVMGLAWSRVAGMLAFAITLIVLTPQRYGLGFDSAQAARMLRFGVPLTAAGLVGCALANLDYVVIGHSLGGETLGLYVLAYTISGWPISVFTSVIMGVGVPAFARVRHDPDRLPEHLAGALRVLTTLSLPVSALTVALALPLVTGVYGEKWRDAVPVLAILAAFGAIRVPLDLFANFLVAMGATKTLLLTQVVWLVVLAPSLVVGVQVGAATGVAVAHVLVGAGLLLFYARCLRRLSGVRPLALLRAVLRPLVAAMVAAGAASTVAARLDGAWTALGVGAVVGAVTYLACLGPWLPSLRSEARTLWSGRAPAVETVPGVVAGAESG
jgi:PST family polysaccharide transporter